MIYCLHRDQLKMLIDKNRHAALERVMLEFFESGLSLPEMYKQMSAGAGPFSDTIGRETNQFARKTENAEVMIALELPSIYNFSSQEQPLICFEMQSGFTGRISSLADLTSNLKRDSHIDCVLQSGRYQYHFQIKRYPGDYLPFDEASIIGFLHDIFTQKYGNMSGTALLILLRPPEGGPANAPDFRQIHGALLKMEDEITFEEISFIFNENMQRINLIRVFPELQRAATPIKFLSEEYQQTQKEWESIALKRQRRMDNAAGPTEALR